MMSLNVPVHTSSSHYRDFTRYRTSCTCEIISTILCCNITKTFVWPPTTSPTIQSRLSTDGLHSGVASGTSMLQDDLLSDWNGNYFLAASSDVTEVNGFEVNVSISKKH
jgi:hypothetical protein